MELLDDFEMTPDVEILYVLPDNQVNEKTLFFVDGNRLRSRVRFLRDPASGAIDRLGLRKQDAEPIEAGVPHPTTLLLDRGGVVRLVDIRTDFQLWLDSRLLVDALAAIP